MDLDIYPGASTTKEISVSISFQHPDTTGEIHTFQVKEMPLEEKNGEITLIFSITDENNEEQGAIIGTMRKKKGKKEFFVFQSKNNTTEKDLGGKITSKSVYKGLVGEAIANLIEKGIVDIWHSDVQISDGAVKMYENLLKRHGNLEYIENDNFPYVLQRNRD
ncbi:hypothetical protein C5B42_02875 [Candidatus Cerribacteria bacterium 'Amazon FNV 2010 28 9']|uniref:Uncharacterized protein n=1 Tax=Candidatus Cerribacteria bacterium 'Amazon FNV 2010 28 9' TaxID=2081795 RepID=A0A317JP99_9BACT|nr:MAG: hypothetical protein C5B42_02875 [Candidatus Cerribacteria bacterium 'Amazon FNV 2010 28 9']